MKKESQQEEVKEDKIYKVSHKRIDQVYSRLRMMTLSADAHDNIKGALEFLIQEDKKE